MKLDLSDQYLTKKRQGNIEKVKTNQNPNKTDLPDTSGNQYNIASNKKRIKEFLGDDSSKNTKKPLNAQ